MELRELIRPENRDQYDYRVFIAAKAWTSVQTMNAFHFQASNLISSDCFLQANPNDAATFVSSNSSRYCDINVLSFFFSKLFLTFAFNYTFV